MDTEQPTPMVVALAWHSAMLHMKRVNEAPGGPKGTTGATLTVAVMGRGGQLWNATFKWDLWREEPETWIPTDPRFMPIWNASASP